MIVSRGSGRDEKPRSCLDQAPFAGLELQVPTAHAFPPTLSLFLSEHAKRKSLLCAFCRAPRHPLTSVELPPPFVRKQARQSRQHSTIVIRSFGPNSNAGRARTPNPRLRLVAIPTGHLTVRSRRSPSPPRRLLSTIYTPPLPRPPSLLGRLDQGKSIVPRRRELERLWRSTRPNSKIVNLPLSAVGPFRPPTASASALATDAVQATFRRDTPPTTRTVQQMAVGLDDGSSRDDSALISSRSDDAGQPAFGSGHQALT